MKKLILLATVMTLAMLSVSAKANVTLWPSDSDMFDLNHNSYYIWTISPSLADGEIITEASFTFYSINNNMEPEDDIMYIRLLDYADVGNAVTALGMSQVRPDIYLGWDYQ